MAQRLEVLLGLGDLAPERLARLLQVRLHELVLAVQLLQRAHQWLDAAHAQRAHEGVHGLLKGRNRPLATHFDTFLGVSRPPERATDHENRAGDAARIALAHDGLGDARERLRALLHGGGVGHGALDLAGVRVTWMLDRRHQRLALRLSTI